MITRYTLRRALASLLLLAATSCTNASPAVAGQPEGMAMRPGLETAIFAGGCFWCMQPPFDKLPGVVATTVGYGGGKEANPTYEEVGRGETGHAEAIKVVYDPKKVSYDKLLDVFWHNINPTDAGGQFVDRGKQYRPAIFYLDARQKQAAIASRDQLARSGRFDKPIVVQIVPATRFWPAEGYHQQYYKKNPGHYHRYRNGSGRDAFLHRTWERP